MKNRTALTKHSPHSVNEATTILILDARDIQKATNCGKHFPVSSNWLDEDFEESILSYPKEIPKTAVNIPQCSKLPPAKKDRGKKSTMFKIEPEISEPAIHNLGLFLSAVEEDQSEPKARGRFWDVLKRKNRTSVSYCAEDFPDSPER